MKPTFILQVYNPEFYKAHNNEPMPILLTRSEYWELAEVDGLDSSFTGVEAESTSEKSGNQNTYTSYENRNVSFTVSLFTPHIDDSLRFFSRYLVNGTYAVLRIAEEPGLYLKCKVSNYEFNRWENSSEVTINLQAIDRFWHFDNTETEAGNGFYVISDTEVKPYITDSTIHTAGADGYTINKLTIDIAHEKLTPPEYGKGINVTTETQRIVFSDIVLSVIDTSEFHFEIDAATPGAYIVLGSSKNDITYLADTDDKSQGDYAIWDWTIQPGFSKITAEYTLNNARTGAEMVISVTDFAIETRPKFITYPKGLTSEETFTLSNYLTAGNIKVGVTILGVKGIYKGSSIDYIGKTEIDPAGEDQTLDTANKYLVTDIIVNPISPILEDDVIQTEISTTDLGGTVIDSDIKDKDDELHVVGEVKNAGWFTENQKASIEYKIDISDAEKKKLIGSNIKKGVTILGVAGELVEGGKYGVALQGGNIKSSLFPMLISNIYIDTSLKLHQNASSLFKNMQNLTSLNCNMFDTSNVTDMSSMFEGVYRLKTLDLSNWNTAKVTNMNSMFKNCYFYYNVWFKYGLITLDISGWNTAEVTDMTDMFYYDKALANVTWGSNWGANVSITQFRVDNCPLTHDSCLDLFNKLANKTETATPAATLVISTTTKALMSEDEIKVATDKGWTVS